MRKEKAKTKNFPTHGTEYKLIQNSKSKMKNQFHHYLNMFWIPFVLEYQILTQTIFKTYLKAISSRSSFKVTSN